MRITKATNITASTTDVLEPTVDNVLNLIENKKIIFKNDVAYWSKGKSVLPKEYRDCIEQTQYAHWINEWSCEQAEKFGDRAYYDYDGDTEVKATNMRITKATKTDVKASRTAKEKFLGTALLENRDDGKIHLNNFPIAPNDRCRYMWKNTMFPTTWNTIDEAIDAIESTLGVSVDRDKLAEMTEPTDHTVLLYLYGTNKAIMSTTMVSANDKALQHIKAAIDILGKSGDKSDVTKDSIANLGVVMFDLKSKK